MNVNDVVNILSANPVIQKLGLSTTEKKNAIKSAIPIAVNEIVTAFNWDFATDKTTETAVVDQATYTLRGKNNDCQDVINIVYGDDMIEEVEPQAMDEFMTGRSITGIGFWVHDGRASGGFPKVKIYATPSSAETMTYRYLRNNVGIGDIPNQYSYVIVSAVLKRLLPSFSGQYEVDVRRMIDSYTRQGNSPMIVRRDPVAVKRNNERAGMNGWS